MTQANRLKELRKRNGYTLDDISKLTGITRGTYNNYENGKTEPKLETWKKLADYFKVPVGYLQGLTDIKEYHLYEDYDYHQDLLKNNSSFRENVSLLDDDKQYDADDSNGRNDILLNQYEELTKMFYYGGEVFNGQLPDKKTRINLIKVIDMIFSNAHQIYEDIQDFSDQKPYAIQEVNKYIYALQKYNPYWWDNTDLNEFLNNESDIHYKNHKLSNNERLQLQDFAENIDKLAQNKKASDDKSETER
ncbi:XRE family transcriptional regulator [Leuconostoc falkenbergense]|uniref:helix-turn-helix domain-containing protein n=1 Tax=Leuconostoc falkenbergense TaxID=2766470 RepID=UPI0021A9AC9B|nr:helix-turn-helix transcriptional regulator [Leuconostoc falkenbergense]MCT4411885.1 XRE family transcriptional regulator [Leuconostoc falkenbergense]